MAQASSRVHLVIRATHHDKVLVSLTPSPALKPSRRPQSSSAARSSGSARTDTGQAPKPSQQSRQLPTPAAPSSAAVTAQPGAAASPADPTAALPSTDQDDQGADQPPVNESPSGRGQKGSSWGRASGVWSSLGSGLGAGLGLNALQPLAASLNQHSWVGPSGLARAKSGPKSSTPKRRSSDIPASPHPAGHLVTSQNSTGLSSSTDTHRDVQPEAAIPGKQRPVHNQLESDPGNIRPASHAMAQAMGESVPVAGPAASAAPAEEVVEGVAAAAGALAAEHALSAGEMTGEATSGPSRCCSVC